MTPTYLPELLDLAVATGRRIWAICSLRYRDLRLNSPRPSDLPKGVPWYGEIAWPADTDKEGREWCTPINELAREALERVLEQRPPFNPEAPIFPSPRDPTEPLRYELASKWLRQAEKKARVEPLDGSLWHAYRRMWATERKHLPAQDVAAAGGWKTVSTVQEIYQRADRATTYAVVNQPTRIVKQEAVSK